jgi:hypothetical protein
MGPDASDAPQEERKPRLRRTPPEALPLGRVLARSCAIFVRRAPVLVPLAWFVFALPTALRAVRVERGADPRATGLAHALAADGVSPLAIQACEWLFALAFQALVAHAVFRSIRGAAVSWSTSIRQGLRRLPLAVGTSLLLLAMLALAVGVFAASSGVPANAVTVWLWLPLTLVAATWLVRLLGRMFVAVPVAVVEGLPPMAAVRRSTRLTREAALHLFAVVLLFYAVPLLAVEAARDWATRASGLGLDAQGLVWFQGALGAVFAALQAVTATVAYQVLRERKEGVGIDELLAVFD